MYQLVACLAYHPLRPTVLKPLLKRFVDVYWTERIVRHSHIRPNKLSICIEVFLPTRPLLKNCPRERSKRTDHLKQVVVVIHAKELVVVARLEVPQRVEGW